LLPARVRAGLLRPVHLRDGGGVMPAAYRKVLPSVWSDPALEGLGFAARALHVLLQTQPDITAAGIVPLLPARWAHMLELPIGEIATGLDVLVKVGKIEIDEVSAEVLVVDFMAVDEGPSSPNGCKHTAAKVAAILSDRLRRRALKEALKVAPKQLHHLFGVPPEPPPEPPQRAPSEAPCEAPPQAPCDGASEAAGEGDASPHALSLSLSLALEPRTRAPLALVNAGDDMHDTPLPIELAPLAQPSGLDATKRHPWSERTDRIVRQYRDWYRTEHQRSCPQSHMVLAKIVQRFDEVDELRLKRALVSCATVSIRSVELALNRRATSSIRRPAPADLLDEWRQVNAERGAS
jgi:hypothetical protein